MPGVSQKILCCIVLYRELLYVLYVGRIQPKIPKMGCCSVKLLSLLVYTDTVYFEINQKIQKNDRLHIGIMYNVC